jgi:hypothetical protein
VPVATSISTVQSARSRNNYAFRSGTDCNPILVFQFVTDMIIEGYIVDVFPLLTSHFRETPSPYDSEKQLDNDCIRRNCNINCLIS